MRGSGSRYFLGGIVLAILAAWFGSYWMAAALVFGGYFTALLVGLEEKVDDIRRELRDRE